MRNGFGRKKSATIGVREIVTVSGKTPVSFRWFYASFKSLLTQLRIELIQSPQRRHGSLLGAAIVVAIGLDQLDVAAWAG